MIREIDKRTLSAYSNLEERKSQFFILANEASSKLESGSVSAVPEINAWTGNLRALKTDQPVAFAQGSLVEKALDYVQAHKESFGFEEVASADFAPDPHIAVTSTGKSVVYLQQVYKGITVFLVTKSVIFNANREIEEALGDSVSFNEEVDVEPKSNVLEAAGKAADAIRSNFEEQEDGWGETQAIPIGEGQAFEAKKLVELGVYRELCQGKWEYC